MSSAVLDLVLLWIIPWFWYNSIGGSADSFAFMCKTELILFCIVFFTVNSFSLRVLAHLY
ncbi:MAG: hypothetical protein MUD12_13450 [Spirochaetes bacterium]|nr:hypothetical protein [Spirochaetota bacterium]